MQHFLHLSAQVTLANWCSKNYTLKTSNHYMFAGLTGVPPILISLGFSHLSPAAQDILPIWTLPSKCLYIC